MLTEFPWLDISASSDSSDLFDSASSLGPFVSVAFACYYETPVSYSIFVNIFFNSDKSVFRSK